MKMNMSTSGFLVLLLCISCGTTMDISCRWYPSREYTDVGMECSGLRVTQMPKLLPSSLELLYLTGTAVSSLDNDTFQERNLEELKTLAVTGGTLAGVGPHAFCALPALRKLDLSHSHLDLLDALSFGCNKQLRTVNLSDNPRLRRLPLLVSSSIETMYIENCSLTSIHVAELEGMTALKTLSLSGNTDLHCLSEKQRLEQALPDLLVICEDNGRESPPVNAFSNTASLLRQSVLTMMAVSIFTIFRCLYCL